MAENENNFAVRKVDSAQNYIKQKYSETIGLATSILGQVLIIKLFSDFCICFERLLKKKKNIKRFY